MNRRKPTGNTLRLVRRAVALAMALITVWGVWLTAGSPLTFSWFDLEEHPDFAVGVMAAQLGRPLESPPAVDGLDLWGRFLLRQSALLRVPLPAESVSDQTAPLPLPEDPAQGDADDRQEHQLDIKPQTNVVTYTAPSRQADVMLPERGLALKNVTDQQVDLAALAEQKVELDLDLKKGPQILIYHTHGSEAYTQTDENRYTESDAFRTTDCNHNVVRVGEEMAKVFRSQGFEVIHDPTLYDYPAYNGSYGRSRAGVEKWLEQYPSIQFALDVHRDALVSQDGAAYQFIAQEGDEKMAQVMLVVGSNDSGAVHPNWRANLALAVKLQLALTARYQQLARPITLRSTRFNQDIAPGILLVEVGGHGNTLEEAIAGAKLFAKTTGAALKELVEPAPPK